MSRYRAVLFDLDGTLLDTLEDLADSMNAALGRHGYPPHPVEAYRHFVGDGVENLARRALPEGSRDADNIDRCLAAMRAEYGRRCDRKSRPYAGVPELLDALGERGLVLAILSNKMDDFTQRVVSKLLADWSFAVVRGALPEVPRKPDPAGAVAIARELEIPPAEFLYLGDTGTDMKTAVSAGMFAVGALWGFRDAPELRESGARKLIARPGELLELLG